MQVIWLSYSVWRLTSTSVSAEGVAQANLNQWSIPTTAEFAISLSHLNDNDVGGTAMYGSRVNSIYQRFYKKIIQVHDCSDDGYTDPLVKKNER